MKKLYTAIASVGLFLSFSFNANAQNHFSGTLNTTSSIEREGVVQIGIASSAGLSTPRFSVISKLYYSGVGPPSGTAANFNLFNGSGSSILNLSICNWEGAPYLLHGKNTTNSVFKVLENGSTTLGHSSSTGTTMLKVNGNVITSGDVSIGYITASKPSGYKLYVAEGIITEKLKVAIQGTASWPDFVFDKPYKLMPLAEVEMFINKNKHLPDVPCAEEMVENGLDVATMDARLLQKIEELTLYMIEMKKENDIIKKELNELKINSSKN